ncbi:peptidase c56 [Grosmannia clavigera kw1407]|uniref:D-lactate dehydratase n=1 Tax=Grosmannia clavigera (strain kw1407 / UAMH 11150) TaxID=655863 RepID=F0X8D3_GROCL|nr:peptidase c56 [Grosmannia clavigera kw1407]EFX05806.1 peptidase c56 [Grosmannia clavigera kw1407]
MASKKILVVLTSHNKLGETGKPTGWYLSEFAHPYEVFAAAGYEITVASPKGGVAPLDPASIDAAKGDAVALAFLEDHKALFEQTTKLSTFAGDAATAKKTAAAFDAVYYPGGHGPLYDLATDVESRRLIAAFALAGKIVSAVCHGPGAFVNVRLNVESPADAASPHLLSGHKVSGFKDSEEAAVGLTQVVPFALESAIRAVDGAEFVPVDDWHVGVVTSGKLITGQNPMSGTAVGEAVVAALK